jgi:ribosomal protein S15P/S13E
LSEQGKPLSSVSDLFDGLAARERFEKMGQKSESIHPRVFYLGGVKKNTCKPRSKVRLVRAKAGIERHIEKHPADAAARQRLSNLERRIDGR